MSECKRCILSDTSRGRMAGRMLFAWMRGDIARNARMAADDALHADAETIEITFAQKKGRTVSVSFVHQMHGPSLQFQKL